MGNLTQPGFISGGFGGGPAVVHGGYGVLDFDLGSWLDRALPFGPWWYNYGIRKAGKSSPKGVHIWTVTKGGTPLNFTEFHTTKVTDAHEKIVPESDLYFVQLIQKMVGSFLKSTQLEVGSTLKFGH